MSICETCGSSLPSGLGSLLCPVCLLAEEDDRSVLGLLRIGSCWVEEEIGRGGMGILYRAEQEDLQRKVALKILPGAAFASEEARTRFRLESAAVAKLRHPGIIAIHEVGEHDSQPYFTMDLIVGKNLDVILKEQTLPSHFAAQICQSLAAAVQYAHEQGVYHRDLKPSNVMIDSDNQPILADFGLARLSESDSKLTLSGQIVGTPSYLPPERARGDSGNLGGEVSGDVYGIGAVLYHMLTGSPPFLGESVSATLEALIQREPVSPRRLRPGLHRDLETICLKCLRKNPADRYATAGEVAADLGRYTAGDAIHATPEKWYVGVARLIRRKPLLAMLIGALAISLVLGVSGMRYQMQLARASQAQTEVTATTLRRELYASDMFAASIALQNHDIAGVRRLLAKHFPAQGIPDIRGFEWYYLNYSSKGNEAAILRGHGPMVTSVSWSPDKQFLASAENGGIVIVWKNGSTTGLNFRPWKRYEFPGTISKIAWSGTPCQLIVAGSKRKTLLIDINDGKTLRSWPGESFALSYDRGYLAIANSGVYKDQYAGAVTLHSMPSGERLREIAPAGRAVAFSPDGSKLAVALAKTVRPNDESGIALYALAEPYTPPSLLTTESAVWALNFSASGNQLAAVLVAGHEIPLWDVASGERIAALVGHTQRPSSCQFIAASGEILTTGADRTIRLWRAADFTELPATHCIGHENEISCAALNPSGNLLATGDDDGLIRLWDWPAKSDSHVPVTASPRLPGVVPPPTDDQSITSVSSPDSRWLVTSTWVDLSLTDTWSGRKMVLKDDHHWAHRIVYHPDGKRFITAGMDGNLKVWTVPDLALVGTLKGHLEKANDLAISPDGLTLASIERAIGIRTWRLDTLREVIKLDLPEALNALYFSADSRRLFYAAKQADGSTTMQVLGGQ